MEEKLTKYHREEIIFILLILAENLSEYENEDLVCFTEAIEGRIDELFKSEKIILFLKEYEINNEIIQKMQVLKSEVTNLYTSMASKVEKRRKNAKHKNISHSNFRNVEYFQRKTFEIFGNSLVFVKSQGVIFQIKTNFGRNRLKNKK